MLGWQVYWGALVIKLFGFSFLVLRLSTAPFAAGCAVLLFSICSRLGLNSRNALLGTLTVVLSPIFIPLAASFMTDVPALFWIFLALYCCLRALPAPGMGSAIWWLTLGSLASLIGGTGRQTDWLGVLVMVPATAWLIRSNKGIWQASLALWLTSISAILLCTAWFRHQPYSVPENMTGFHINRAMFLALGHNMTVIFFSTVLFCLPGLVGYLPTLRTMPPKRLLPLVAVLAVVLYLGLGRRLNVFAPWMMGVVTSTTVDSDFDGLGLHPTVLTMPVRVVITVFMGTVLYAFLQFVLTKPQVSATKQSLSYTSWRSLFVLLGPFTLAYLALLVPRAGSKGVLGITVFDRYLLPLLPVAIILALRLYQEQIQPHAPAFAFVTLAAFSFFAIANTHDYFASERARLAAATELTSAGVPRTAIEASMEYVGWTELQANGHLNDSRIQVPSNAYHATSSNLTGECWFWFADHTPSIHPKYFVVTNPLSCLAPPAMPPVSYRAWLPPFHRQMFIQTRRARVAAK
jgi:4-amino-4-deoxy-L-arabinose transferase-like glycosyltransferase